MSDSVTGNQVRSLVDTKTDSLRTELHNYMSNELQTKIKDTIHLMLSEFEQSKVRHLEKSLNEVSGKANQVSVLGQQARVMQQALD